MFILGEIIGWEFLLVLALIALLFGSSKLPKLARSMGQAKSELEKGMREGADTADKADKKDDPAES
jgi:sec-independent protein translocase protein TatA